MSRRRAIAYATFLLIASLISSSGSSSGARPATPARVGLNKPNILVVVTDDQRGGMRVMPKTGKMIRKRGIRFTQTYATTPLCCPSRSSIFTGQYAHNHNVRTNGGTPNLDHDTTIQRYLSQAGYATALFGKFLNRWAIEKAPPYFDHFLMMKTGKRLPRYYDATWNMNGDISVVNGYSTHLLGRQVAEFLDGRERRKRDRRPWYIYLAPNAPHSPFEASKKFDDAKVPPWSPNPAVFEKDKTDKPPYIAAAHRSPEKGARVRRKQLRTLMSVDELVEKVLDRLREFEENRQTLVLYISDNAYFWSEHGLSGKNVPYRVGSRVPMMMKWPGHVPPGSTDRRLTANIDVAPTLADAANLEDQIQHTFDGRSLLDKSWTRDRLLLESYVPDWASTVNRSYQYNEYYDETGKILEFHEFYDLENDPWQLENLLVTDPTSVPVNVAMLKAQLAMDRSCAGEGCP